MAEEKVGQVAQAAPPEINPESANIESSVDVSAQPAIQDPSSMQQTMEPTPDKAATQQSSESTSGTSAEARTIEDLPNELLSTIFRYLDAPKPSDTGLDVEPTIGITDADVADLKSTSRVSKRWRQATMPILFRHSRFIVEEPKPGADRPIMKDHIQPFLDFVTENSLAAAITSFALLVIDRGIINRVESFRWNDFATFWHAIFDTIDPLELLIVAHPEALSPLTDCYISLTDTAQFDCPYHYLRLQRPQTAAKSTAELKGKEKEVVSQEPTSELTVKVKDEAVKTGSIHDLKAQNEGEASIGEPASSETVTSAPISATSQRGADPFGNTDEPWEITHADHSTLFAIRPWTKLLLNEGSFIRVYCTYEWWHRATPSILTSLVGNNDEIAPIVKPLISPTIREMSYIALFPTSAHFDAFAKNLPRLDRLYMQLVPRSDILNDPDKMKLVELEDLWMERNRCYALVVRELFNNPPTHNYKYIREFESGDTADTDAWQMAVEFVKRNSTGWRVASEGVFVRDLPFEKSEDQSDLSTYQGALMSEKYYGISDTGNKVSRRSQIIGTTNIILGGKTVIQAEVIIRGDLLRTTLPSSSSLASGSGATGAEKGGGVAVAVAIGRYCVLSRGCVLRPPGKFYKG
ncbi:hypothetical protein B7494_g2703, partial [Chlorociboria aeruginascens]